MASGTRSVADDAANLLRDWKQVSLKEVAELRRETVQPKEAGLLPYVGLEHLEPGNPRIRLHGSPEDVRSTKSKFRSGDVLFAKLRPYLDKAALAEWDGIASTDILILSPTSIDSEFLAYLVHLPQFIAHATSTMTGVNHPRTSWSSLGEWELALPPEGEQRAIAGVLRSIQQAREATEKVIAATRELRRSVLKHLFTYGPASIADAEDVEIKEKGSGSYPSHWSSTTLGDVAQIERGKFSHRPRNDSAFYGGKTPFIQTGDVTAAASLDGYVRTFSQTLNDRGLGVSRVFPQGTIAITIAANIGFSAILTFDCAFPDSIIGITPTDGVDARFLNYFLITQQTEMDRLAPRGTQKNINIAFLRPWPVALPPIAEQERIISIVGAVDQKLRAERLRAKALDQQFNSCLQELMNRKRLVTSQEVVGE